MYGSGLYLGWRNGMLSQLLYLALGLLLPVYAGDTFGPAYLFAAPSAGYLLALPLAAAVVGLLSRNWKSPLGGVLCLLQGECMVYWIECTIVQFVGERNTGLRVHK